MRLDARLRLLLVLSGVFVTALVVGDIMGGKLFAVRLAGSWTVTAGMLLFPLTFLLTDLLNEFYGKRAARTVTLVAFAMALIAYGAITVAVWTPWAPMTADWGGYRDAYAAVFGGSRRILVASLIAFLVGQFLDIGAFHWLKRLSRNRWLWLRATGSTVLSQLVDTFVIDFLFLWGKPGMSTRAILGVVGTGYLVKLVVAIGLTPVIYAGHVAIERWLGLGPVVLGPDGEPIPEKQKASGPSPEAFTQHLN